MSFQDDSKTIYSEMLHYRFRAVPGVIKVYQDRFYMENQWNICVKATVIVE